MSSLSSIASLDAALGAPPAQSLTRRNFLLWKALVLPAFRGANVMGLLDGTDRAPPKTIEVEDSAQKKSMVDNPAYLAWVARDQQVLRFLLNLLSPDILSHVLGMDSTIEAWSVLSKMFSTASRTKVQHLRSALNDTKKSTMSVHQYFTTMKGFASELAVVGKPLEEDELIGHFLHGLDGTYNALVTVVDANPVTSVDDLFGLMSSYDMHNDNSN